MGGVSALGDGMLQTAPRVSPARRTQPRAAPALAPMHHVTCPLLRRSAFQLLFTVWLDGLVGSCATRGWPGRLAWDIRRACVREHQVGYFVT